MSDNERERVLRVRPHEVNAGDRFIGAKPVVHRLLLDCGQSPARWLYYDEQGKLICRKRMDAIVQVIRGGA